MQECNRCEMRRCDSMYSTYPKLRTKHKFSASMLSTSCHRYVPPTTLKYPILMYLATDTNKIVSLETLLELSGFWLEEIERYPYFRLRMEK